MFDETNNSNDKSLSKEAYISNELINNPTPDNQESEEEVTGNIYHAAKCPREDIDRAERYEESQTVNIPFHNACNANSQEGYSTMRHQDMQSGQPQYANHVRAEDGFYHHDVETQQFQSSSSISDSVGHIQPR